VLRVRRCFGYDGASGTTVRMRKPQRRNTMEDQGVEAR
jgi:hypothetical protein